MLQQICEYYNNYFDDDEAQHYAGTYTIEDGAVSPLPLLKEGQRFRVVDSDLNDGIYTYHADGITTDDDTAGAGLADEVFTGAIHGLSVPPQLIAMLPEINSRVEKYGDVIYSPFSGEQFAGYGYTRATGSPRGTGKSTDASGGLKIILDAMLPKRWKKVAIL